MGNEFASLLAMWERGDAQDVIDKLLALSPEQLGRLMTISNELLELAANACIINEGRSLRSMPVRRSGGGYRYGSTGKVYTGKGAKSKAAAQGRAIRASQNSKKKAK